MKPPITDKERQHVLKYLEKHALGKDMPKPLTALSKMLLENFGWPTPAGKKRATLILEELAAENKLRRLYDAKNALLAVHLIKEEAAETTKPAPTAPSATIPRRRCRHGHQKLGAGKRRKLEARKIGDRNESRCCQITHRIVTMLRILFPDQIVEASYVRSGRHNPKEGKIDTADHHGEDVGIQISAKFQDGSTLTGRIVIDAKSSEWRTTKFNDRIHMGRYEAETGVLAKRAITVNHLRPESEVARDILATIIAGGFNFIATEQETIIAAFRSC